MLQFSIATRINLEIVICGLIFVEDLNLLLYSYSVTYGKFYFYDCVKKIFIELTGTLKNILSFKDYFIAENGMHAVLSIRIEY